jgi:hypothetical protein
MNKKKNRAKEEDGLGKQPTTVHAGRKAAPNCRSTGGSASMSSLRSHSGGIVSGNFSMPQTLYAI